VALPPMAMDGPAARVWACAEMSVTLVKDGKRTGRWPDCRALEREPYHA
jgi:hypothetical protein